MPPGGIHARCARRGQARKPLGILALLLLLFFGIRSHPQNYPHNFKGEWLRATEVVTSRPGAGVLAEKYSAAVNLESYPTFYGRKGVPNVVFVKDAGAKRPKGGRTTLGNIKLADYLATLNEVYVVSEGKGSAAADYVSSQPGWNSLRR